MNIRKPQGMNSNRFSTSGISRATRVGIGIGPSDMRSAINRTSLKGTGSTFAYALPEIHNVIPMIAAVTRINSRNVVRRLTTTSRSVLLATI